jgi:hypothetical protein
MLAIGALLAAADGPDSAGWVRRLGSDRFAERVEAAKALDRLGPAALPALRAARDSENPRIRARVAALLETLDRGDDVGRLTRPTLIKLDFHDRPLSEVVDALNARHDLGLTFQFGPLPGKWAMRDASPAQLAKEAEVRSRRVTLEAEGPLPFWQAIDRLCEAGHLQHDLHPQERFGLTKGRFLLFSGVGGTSISSDSGPFRVRILGLHSRLERDLVGATSPGGGVPQSPAPDRGGGDLSLRMAVIPEPGLVVRQVGPTTFVEAVDDRDRRLLPPDGKLASEYASMTGHQVPSLNGSSGFELRASLRIPDLAGRSIRRLRGSVPVVVVAYSSRPIVIPLEGAAGKSFRNDEVTVSVIEVDRNDNAGVTVEVEVTPNGPAPAESDLWTRPGPPDFATFRMGVGELLNRLELFDADGRELDLSWNQTHSRDFLANQRRVRLTPTILYEDAPPDPGGGFERRIPKRPVPVELRYYGFVQTLTSIPFDFRDVLLP